MASTSGHKPRGFAALSKERRTEIARKGGKASRGGGNRRRATM